MIPCPLEEEASGGSALALYGAEVQVTGGIFRTPRVRESFSVIVGVVPGRPGPAGATASKGGSGRVVAYLSLEERAAGCLVGRTGLGW